MTSTPLALKTPSRKRGGWVSGFTLLEMILVIAIVALIMAIGFSTFSRESRIAIVRQQSVELQADLESLRSASIRYNRDATFERLSSTSYRLTLPTGDPAAPRVVTRDWTSTGVSYSGGENLRYRAPNAELQSFTFAPLTSVNEFELSLSNIVYYVKVLGVTGKVVLSATN
jgi:prepilin-type N-terminal cleavage/methylation domain-containing protein